MAPVYATNLFNSSAEVLLMYTLTTVGTFFTQGTATPGQATEWLSVSSPAVKDGALNAWADDTTAVIAQAIKTPNGKQTIAPLMSTETMKLIECIAQVGFLPAVVVAGVVLNIINVLVFVRQGLRDHINFCLTSLAVADTGYLVSLMIFRAYAIADLVGDITGEYYQARTTNVIGLYCAFSTTSNSLTMLIAVERCVCVLWPLKAKTILTTRKIRVLGVLAFVVCFPCNIIFCFKYDVLAFQDPVTNVTRYRPTVTPFYLRHPHVIDFVYENFSIVVPTVAFCVVIMCTVAIAVRMRSVLAWRQTTANVSSQKDMREASLTRMLTVICVIFTVTQFPYVISAFTRLVIPEYRPEGSYTNTLFASTGIMHLIMCINSTVNFFVYYSMSSKYKAVLRQMLGLDRAKPEDAQVALGRPSTRKTKAPSVSSDSFAGSSATINTSVGQTAE